MCICIIAPKCVHPGVKVLIAEVVQHLSRNDKILVSLVLKKLRLYKKRWSVCCHIFVKLYELKPLLF